MGESATIFRLEARIKFAVCEKIFTGLLKRCKAKDDGDGTRIGNLYAARLGAAFFSAEEFNEQVIPYIIVHRGTPN
jgi:hypothetical protein